jgi:predicted nucleotidyltransferase
MRLSAIEIRHIKEVIHRADREAHIYLFGSRVDDQKRGGDIDLLVISSILTLEDKQG